MATFKDLAGMLVGRWKVLHRCERPKGKAYGTWWMCECQCVDKTTQPVNGSNLGAFIRTGVGSGNCGCVRREALKAQATHGKSSADNTDPLEHRTYNIWKNMKRRCNSPTCTGYENYGGRGITYDPAWESFEKFHEDMGTCPDKLTLERVDVNGNYTKENCVWATRKQQCRNTRKTVHWTHNGVTKSIAEWAEEYGVKLHLLYCRLLRMKLPFEEAVSVPVGGYTPTYEYRGQRYTIKQLAEMTGLPVKVLNHRIKHWDIERAINTPLKPDSRRKT